MADKLDLNEETVGILPRALRMAGLFSDVRSDDIPALFPNSGLLQYFPSEHIIEQDAKGTDLYVLCSGQVIITKTFGSAGVTLATLQQGAVFGEMAALRDGIRAATVMAQTACLVFCIGSRDLQAVLKSHPQVATLLQALASQRSQ